MVQIDMPSPSVLVKKRIFTKYINITFMNFIFNLICLFSTCLSRKNFSQIVHGLTSITMECLIQVCLSMIEPDMTYYLTAYAEGNATIVTGSQPFLSMVQIDLPSLSVLVKQDFSQSIQTSHS